jgi:hypothetical protein
MTNPDAAMVRGAIAVIEPTGGNIYRDLLDSLRSLADRLEETHAKLVTLGGQPDHSGDITDMVQAQSGRGEPKHCGCLNLHAHCGEDATMNDCPGIATAPLAPVAGLDYITGAVEDFAAGRISAGKFGELLGARDLHTFKNRCVVDGGDDGPKHCACEFPADYNDPRIEPLKECAYHVAMRKGSSVGGKVTGWCCDTCIWHVYCPDEDALETEAGASDDHFDANSTCKGSVVPLVRERREAIPR